MEDLIDPPSSHSPHHSSPPSSSNGRAGLHASEALNSLLYAAEIKHQEREYQVARPTLPGPMPTSPIPASGRANLMLPSIQSVQNGFGNPEPNFANLQSLLGFLEEIKHKHHPK